MIRKRERVGGDVEENSNSIISQEDISGCVSTEMERECDQNALR